MATLHPPQVDGTPTPDQDPPEKWTPRDAPPDAPVNPDDYPNIDNDPESSKQPPEQPKPSNPQTPDPPNVPSALYEQQQRAFHDQQHQYSQRPVPPSNPPAQQQPSSSSSAGCKIFVGGLSWETDEQSLRAYFEQIGTVLDCVIMRDRHTGHPRGFGFVTFADEDAATAAASRRHDLDGRQVEAKRAVPRSEGSSASTAPGHNPSFPAAPRGQRYNDAPGAPPHRAHHTTKCKVFVGGLPSGCGGEEFRAYFSQFGEVIDAQVMIDHNTGNSRGFGFVTFANEATVNAVVGPGKSNTDHEIMGKCVEVKRAEPKGVSQDRRHNRDSYNQGAGRAGASASQNDGLPHSGANGSGANAAAAAAAAYYSNYPASLAEQYGAYYNSPQWQQYYAAMGYNFNFPQSYNPYQQYLQAYMNTQASANGTGGSAAMPANAASPNAPGAGGFDNSHVPARYRGGGGGHGGDMGHGGPQNGHGHGSNNSGGGPGSRRSSRRDDRYHPYR
ncbi:putative RNA-binding protein [Gracilariopsis chorda]|uniref:Putative RNA-binding protein n=1 Tax=Gracilariopsis chorda TaxID=448386 RepID=A0A2V3J3F1_9FLOR|nr:putative RNA-binding protein [Gracilariopsis chorda]|eukprot:PXF48863.1 putative RNA-binding protein [Gracilariopsis chorda]